MKNGSKVTISVPVEQLWSLEDEDAPEFWMVRSQQHLYKRSETPDRTHPPEGVPAYTTVKKKHFLLPLLSKKKTSSFVLSVSF